MWNQMLKVADAHAHLVELKDLDAIIDRATKAGVIAIVSMGVSLRSNNKTLQIAKEYRNHQVKILPALGLHPWGLDEKDIEPTIVHIRENIRESAGIGEIGLDYWRKDGSTIDPSKKEIQHLAFKKTIKLAKEFDKPISVHSRGAWEDCFNIIVEQKIKKAIFHWFSGPVKLVKKITAHNFYISTTPALKYSKEHRSAILNTPLENLLLETDSPVKYGDLKSEPKDVLIPLKEVSKFKNVKIHEVAEKTTRNFLSIFEP